MMALSAHEQNLSFDATGDDMKDMMRTRALEMLLQLP